MYTLIIYLLTIYLIVSATQWYYGIFKKIRNLIKVRKPVEEKTGNPIREVGDE